jgi:ribose/xylose/arabinose/galactoside ABC-type transport system permease subunit
MLYTLGIGSAVALAAAVITVICDQVPNFNYWVVTLALCTIGFLVGLIYITPVSQTKHVEKVTPFFSLLFENSISLFPLDVTRDLMKILE